MKKYEQLIIDLSGPQKTGYVLPENDVPQAAPRDVIPDALLRKGPVAFPQVSEVEAVRHYTLLSQKNYGVDAGFYPLGSCTMKYNPKINEDMASLEGLTDLHPYQPESTVQGALELMYRFGELYCELTGMKKCSMQPAAGAHGELTGLMIIKSYHQARGESGRKKIIVPDTSHGTNPASAAEAGFEIISVESAPDGTVDIEKLAEALDENVAGLMLTNPNTLGLFEKNIMEISSLVHKAGGLLYYDGANMNAIMGITRPGDMGFDIVHLNTHKTLSTPHGGGGPGAGPVGVTEALAKYLPAPTVEKRADGTDGENKYCLDYDRPASIGKIRSFYSSFNVIVRAYSYILTMGGAGLKKASQTAVLNANYLKEKLKQYYILPYDTTCMHEFVFSGLKNAEGTGAIDIAKRLIDLGFHPPTTYFPITVENALMIEPTETESKETLDAYIEAMIQIAKEGAETPELLKQAPVNATVRRVDELSALKNPVLKWRDRHEPI